VLDTSFNIRGEPIVETPLEALRCFLSSNMDALYVEGYRVTKVSIADVENVRPLIPVVNDALALGSSMDAHNGGWTSEAWYVQRRTGHRIKVSRAEVAVLRLIDGERSIAEINDSLAEKLNGRELKTLFSHLQGQGLISFLAG
jgi:hypothetical protein